ncbi:BTAD domain-containing putative transcriptional regulator [Actinomycetes bacterium KLBMP 9797]
MSIPPGQMRLLLASLLVAPGHAVPAEVVAERLWPERMPMHARAAVHTYVARLRRLLGKDAIETAHDGYRLTVAESVIDLWRFRRLLERAAAAGTAEAELPLLRQALSLWRGRPFVGIESTWLDREVVPRLREEWFTALERRIDLEIAANHAGSVIPELRDLVGTYPTRESLWLRLIDALHRSGRRAEALEAYQQVRVVLSEELGVSPGDALQRIHREVLKDSAPAVRAEAGVTRQLPPDLANFVRRPELARLDALRPVVRRNARLTHLVAIDGAPGTGKTALAAHWAHQVADGYPEVQLYLNLRGYGPGEPVSASAAVEILLRALGVRGDLIPRGVDQRAAMLRSTLAGRRVLLLLDNARDAEQVRPLLPGGESLVIVTSRNQLRGLSIRDGAHRVTLGPLPPDGALALLAGAVGSARVAAEPDAAARLTELCAGLPLALAIVAERAYNAGGLAEVARALEDERLRFDVLGGDGDADLWAALSWSYRALDDDAAALLRALALHPANDISLEAAAALAGLPVRRTRQVLLQLHTVHLVQQRRAHRYELHDLVRWYAADLAARQDTEAERAAAVGRLLDWYLHAAVAADTRLLPHRQRHFVAPYEPHEAPPAFADAAAAMAWFEREFDCLRAVISWAGAHGWGGHAWRIVTAMTAFFERQIPWQDAIDVHRAALEAAAAAGERMGEGYLLNALGCLYYFKGDRHAATKHLRQALARFRAAGHARGEAMLLGNLGLMHGERGDHGTAREYAARALALCDALGYERGRALNLDNLGVACYAAGEFERAIDCHSGAHVINTRIGDVHSEAMNQHHLGRAYAATGRHRPALRAYRTAIKMYRELGNPRFEALILVDVGRALDRAGHPGMARAAWQVAVVTLKEFDDPQALEIQERCASLP